MRGVIISLSTCLIICFLLFSTVLAVASENEITVVYNRGVAPIKFTSESGEPSGILNEYWKLLGRKAGLDFRFVEVDSFDESLEMVKSGRADLHAGLFYTEERSHYLGYSEPILDLNYYIFSSPELPVFSSLAETRGYLLGVVQGGYTESYIKKAVPDSRLVIYDDVDSLLESVLAGELKVFVASDLHLNYFLAARGLENPFRHTLDSLYQKTYHGAVVKQKQALLNDLVSAQHQLSATGKRQLRERWLFAKVHSVLRPRITTLSEEEIAWIKEHPVIRVSNEMDWPPFDFNQSGQPQGLSIDLLNLIAENTGLKLDFKYGYSWNQLLEMLRNKQLDILHSLNHSASRAEFMLFTEPYISNQTVIVTAEDNDDINEIGDLNHKRVAVIADYNQREVLENVLTSVTFVPVDSPLEALKAVASGRADATIRFNGVASYLINHHMLANLKFVNEFKTLEDNLHELFFAVRNDWPVLRGILQKGLDAVTDKEMQALKRKWISLEQRVPSERISLSDTERQWIAEHPRITLGSDYRWPPFDFVDKQGRHAGLSADYIELIEQRTGLEINVRSGIWAEILSQMKAGELDGFACAVKNEERTAYLNFSRPYLGVPSVIVVKQGNQNVHQIYDLYGKTVSINKGSYMHDWLAKHYPQIRLHLSTSNEASLEAVSYGEADAYIGNLAVANYIIRERLLTNLKVVRRLDSLMTHTSFAIDKHQPLLLSIIQKALDSITDQERQEILSRWYLAATEDTIALTPEEQAWLQQHQVVRFAGAANWAPVSYCLKDGSYAGLTENYLELLGKKCGLRFEAVPVESWSEALQIAREGEVDLINALPIDRKHAEWVDFTDPYLHADAVLVTRDNINFVDGLGRLEDKLVGAVRDFAVAESLVKDYPNLDLRLYPTAADGLQALSQGRLDLFVVDIPTFEYYSKQLSLVNLKISGLTPYTFNIAVGVVKGQPELVSILNKSLALVTQKERNRIYNNWVTLDKPLVDYSLIWKTALAAAFFLLAMFYWNRRLAYEVNRRKKAEEEALQASRAKSDFLANMSHEIRTPMNSVLGFAELLDHMISDPEQKNYLKSIRSGGQSLLAVIDDILDLSKVEAGKMIIRPENVSLGTLFDEMEELFKSRMAQKKLDFSCRIADGFPDYVTMDGARLRQILINLIGNALKFTETGSVKLICENLRIAEDQKTIGFDLTVSDTGIGIPEDQQDLIFNKFEQQEGLDTAKHGGTGLGLAICKSISGLMGGSIAVRSKPGKGAVFKINFPAVPIAGHAEESALSETISVTQFREGTILVADDRKDNRMLVKGYFNGSRVSIVEAENGSETLELMKNAPPDLVLMDLRMPVMSGYEAISAIKADATLKNTPVVAFTASVMGEDMEKVNRYGFGGYLRKPINRADLFRVVSRFYPLTDEHREIEQPTVKLESSPQQLKNFLDSSEKNLMVLWRDVKDRGDFDLIGTFVQHLEEEAQRFSVTELNHYVSRLKECLNSFDIAEVDRMMMEFPGLLAELKQRSDEEGGGDEA